MSTTQRLPYAVAIVLCALAISSTQQYHKELANRIAKQEELIQTRTAWNNQLEAMKPMEARWGRTLPAMSDVSDQYRIVQHINASALGLSIPEAGLTVGAPGLLAHHGRPIGLLRYPVSNQSGNLRLTAPDFSTAWQGLSGLIGRPDIRFSRARLENDKGTPTLILESFAVLARAEAQ